MIVGDSSSPGVTGKAPGVSCIWRVGKGVESAEDMIEEKEGILKPEREVGATDLRRHYHTELLWPDSTVVASLGEVCNVSKVLKYKDDW